MNILLYAHDFRRENLRLMPWRYIHEVAKGLLKRGHRVNLVSPVGNGNTHEEEIDGIKVLRIKKKGMFRGDVFLDVARKADCIIWSSSPMIFFFHRMFRTLDRPLIPLFTGPFYKMSEVVRAQHNGVPATQLTTHYKNAMAPLHFTASFINAPFVSSAVVLSGKNAGILKNYGCSGNKVTVIPPGYDGADANFHKDVSTADFKDSLSVPNGSKIVTYLGSLYQIRGVDLLLEAFSRVCSRSEDMFLMVLARTEKKEEIEILKRKVAAKGIAERIVIIPGFLGKEKVTEYLCASDMVALPFVLVPSDMPVGALEAMALGKPVITADIDGMPEMVAGRGLVVPTGDASALAEAVCTLNRDSRLYDTCRQNCVEYMNSYPSWEGIVERFDAVIQQNT